MSKPTRTMQSNAKRGPESGYKLQSISTGGVFLSDDKAPGSAPLSKLEPVFEPSPIVGGAYWYAYITLGYNLTLHVLAVIFVVIAAAYHIPVKHAKLTTTHSTDFVASWMYVALIAQIVVTLGTLVYYGLVIKAHSFAVPGSVLLGLQLAALLSSVKLSYYLAVDDMDAGETLHAKGDWAIVLTMYLQIFLTAGYIFTPSSGVYYKTVP